MHFEFYFNITEQKREEVVYRLRPKRKKCVSRREGPPIINGGCRLQAFKQLLFFKACLRLIKYIYSSYGIKTPSFGSSDR